MKLDRSFAREVEKASNGDGSREARLAFLATARKAVKRLSTPNVMREFNDILREYGRATVGLCVAVTIWERRDRLERRFVRWAEEVLKLWHNRPRNTLSLYIGDGLHTTRIVEYAGSLIKITTEED